MATIDRKCDNCNKSYKADTRNINRGWGLCCSKSCAASKREKSKPDYNPDKVAQNNIKRAIWNSPDNPENFRGYTSEGYKIYGRTAYDEFGEPVYNIDLDDDTHPFDLE